MYEAKLVEKEERGDYIRNGQSSRRPGRALKCRKDEAKPSTKRKETAAHDIKRAITHNPSVSGILWALQSLTSQIPSETNSGWLAQGHEEPANRSDRDKLLLAAQARSTCQSELRGPVMGGQLTAAGAADIKA